MCMKVTTNNAYTITLYNTQFYVKFNIEITHKKKNSSNI
jgi:hypothetical protein